MIGSFLTAYTMMRKRKNEKSDSNCVCLLVLGFVFFIRGGMRKDFRNYLLELKPEEIRYYPPKGLLNLKIYSNRFGFKEDGKPGLRPNHFTIEGVDVESKEKFHTKEAIM